MITHRAKRSMSDITFFDRDFKCTDTYQDDSMVIAVEVANCDIKKMLVDQGSSVDVLY